MMLNGVDKETGQKLSEQSIKNNVCPVNFCSVTVSNVIIQLLTFLIAGKLYDPIDKFSMGVDKPMNRPRNNLRYPSALCFIIQ